VHSKGRRKLIDILIDETYFSRQDTCLLPLQSEN
jgi:hypothetical protein